jgi:hypothetical protein
MTEPERVERRVQFRVPLMRCVSETVESVVNPHHLGLLPVNNESWRLYQVHLLLQLAVQEHMLTSM